MDDMIEEFHLEAQEIFEEAEEALLGLDRGEDFQGCFNGLFRAFHSLKGAAGMFGLDRLQTHMHYLENLLEKNKADISPGLIDYFFRGVDVAKAILSGDEEAGLGPYSAANESGSSELDKRASKIKRPESKGLIFCVDDEEGALEFLCDVVEDLGYECKGFLDPNSFLNALEGGRPDCVVSDYKMPEMSGVELMQKTHDIYPMLPIVLSSAYVTKEICMEAISKGVSAIAEKPINQKVFAETLEVLVGRYQAIKLIDRSLNLFLYHYSDLNTYLEDSNKKHVRSAIKSELSQIMAAKKALFKKGR